MKKTGVLVVLSLVLFVTAQAQSDQERSDLDELANIGKSIKEKISKEMPGWTHRSIQPIEGSQGVIIQLWQTGDIAVNIAITKYLIPQKAEGAFNEFKSMFRVQEQAARSRGKSLRLVREDLSTVGDEGFVLDDLGSEAVTFRKGRFIVNVSIQHPESRRDVFFSRKFAQHVATALESQ